MRFEVQRYPEWRQLTTRIKPLLDKQEQFSYAELEELAGIDIRSDRGRSQFYKFRREALKAWQLWFENIPAFGYTVVPAGQQPKAAYRRVRQARRRVGVASAINALARIEKMTPAERLLQAQTAALLHDLGTTFRDVGRQFSLVAARLQLPIDEATIAKIADGPKRSE